MTTASILVMNIPSGSNSNSSLALTVPQILFYEINTDLIISPHPFRSVCAGEIERRRNHTRHRLHRQRNRGDHIDFTTLAKRPKILTSSTQAEASSSS